MGKINRVIRIWSPTYQQQVFKRYHGDERFSTLKSFTYKMAAKSTDTDMEQNYATVTQCIVKVYHSKG